jgi:NADPH-dependent ferric siderophore reductase
MPSIVDLVVKNIFQQAIITFKAKITPSSYHIKLQADEFKSYAYIPGEHLRLFVGLGKETGLDEKLRTYSIWAFDAEQGVVDLAVCTHSSGIGATWAREVNVGDTIYYKGPTAKLVIDHAGSDALMIGDDSALSHLYAIRRSIPATKRVTGLIYAGDKSALYADIDGNRPFNFLELPQNPTDQLIAEISALKDQFPKGTIAYLAGDARVCKDLGRYLRQELKWEGWQVKSKGFWMPGKTGMD